VKLLSYTEFLLKESVEYPINEGGAFGHLSHPFEDLDLSMNDIYDMIKISVNAAFSSENFVQEKTDGQQISITWKDGTLKAARNKMHLRNGGENAMDASALALMFQGRGNIEKAFNLAFADLQSSISALSDSDKLKYFNNGEKFASVEIITPMTQNTVPYGQNMLIFHGVIQYDKDGNPIGDDKQAGKELGKLISDANAEVQNNFYVRGPQDISLLPLPNAKKRESYYLGRLNSIIKENNLSLSSTIETYANSQAIRLLKTISSDNNISIPDEYVEPLAKRLTKIDTSFTLNAIKKSLDSNAYQWYKEYENKEQTAFRKKVFRPLEEIFLELGAEIMKNITVFLTANPTQAAEEMKSEITKAINTIKTTGGEEDVKKMQYELERISAVGGLDSIVPAEGITFMYKGKLYKYTGIFAALNQLRGILIYGR